MYFTVGCDSSAELSVKHSKFLAFCARVSDEEQAENFIKGVKKRYSDATHAPYAYLLGELCDKSRASDDGEPSGTSGVPILEAIKNAGLTFTAVVVVRYFGGIKLGTGGLARAYGDAAAQAITAAGKVVFDLCTTYTLSCDYGDISALHNKIFSFGGIIKQSDYANGATILAAIPSDKCKAFLSSLADASSGRIRAVAGEEIFCEIKSEV